MYVYICKHCIYILNLIFDLEQDEKTLNMQAQIDGFPRKTKE